MAAAFLTGHQVFVQEAARGQALMAVAEDLQLAAARLHPERTHVQAGKLRSALQGDGLIGRFKSFCHAIIIAKFGQNKSPLPIDILSKYG
jgi:hypothetical protein